MGWEAKSTPLKIYSPHNNKHIVVFSQGLGIPGIAQIIFTRKALLPEAISMG